MLGQIARRLATAGSGIRFTNRGSETSTGRSKNGGHFRQTNSRCSLPERDGAGTSLDGGGARGDAGAATLECRYRRRRVSHLPQLGSRRFVWVSGGLQGPRVDWFFERRKEGKR